MTYSEKFKNPLWQRKRLDVLDYYSFSCANCGDDKHTLNVHHLGYKKGADPWDYPIEELICLCDKCHSEFHIASSRIMTLLRNVDSLIKLRMVSGYILSFKDGPSEREIENYEEEIGFNAGVISQKKVYK